MKKSGGERERGIYKYVEGFVHLIKTGICEIQHIYASWDFLQIGHCQVGKH